MSNESTQPFNINENTGQPSHRPEHDKARDEADAQLAEADAQPISPSDTTTSQDAENEETRAAQN